MTTKSVRVRIAPSPTGIPHIGNTRTALFNYLFAKKNKGVFLLRIEDTDRARLVPESETAIREILEWLGLSWDEEYKQSERLAIYKEHGELLKQKGLAYEDAGALRFTMPKTGTTSWQDAIGKKDISFENTNQEDFILLKSDGYPTYNFANVIDDHFMHISHVIRGDEFISSTAKHIQLYRAFGWELPVFAHLPVILGPDHQKLSKRHGAKSALDYRKEGYLKEALLNYMVLLGWSPGGDKELMSIEEMISLFDLSLVNTAGPIFDEKKLLWFNKQWIMKKAEIPYQFTTLVSGASIYSQEPNFAQNASGTARLIAPRIGTIKEYDNLVMPLYKKPEINNNLFSQDYQQHLRCINQSLEVVGQWNKNEIEKILKQTVLDNNFKTGDFFMNLRIAITGNRVSMPLNDLLEIIGKNDALERLKKALS